MPSAAAQPSCALGAHPSTSGNDLAEAIDKSVIYVPAYEQRNTFVTAAQLLSLLRTHARGMHSRAQGGSVVLRSTVPPSAIISKVPGSKDCYREAEYLVDRRTLDLGTVTVVRRHAARVQNRFVPRAAVKLDHPG